MTVTAACNSVRVVSVTDDKGQDIRYQHVSTLRDMMTISLQPSIAGPWSYYPCHVVVAHSFVVEPHFKLVWSLL